MSSDNVVQKFARSLTGTGISRILRLLGCAMIVLAAAQSALSQIDEEEVHVTPRAVPVVQPSPGTPALAKPTTATFKANSDLVLVSVTITDPMNRIVLGLDKENFQVFENKELQPIRNFSSEDAPISLGVIFDTSGSMQSKIERAREAAIQFFSTANPQDEFFMIKFADSVQEIADFTNSVDDIQNKLIYTVPKGRTALLDAIYVGISKMRQAKYPKKALLIISDGGDNHSRYTEREVTNLVREADVMIYSIGIYDHYFPTEEERLGPELLNSISELTGGRSFTIDDPNDLADAAAKVSAELRNQYLLGYRPVRAARDGKWHKITVKLMVPKGLPRLHVYAKKGYYAPSE